MNSKSIQLWSLVWVLLILGYGIYLAVYLKNSKKYVSQMSAQDQNVRKAALVITVIQVVTSGLIALGLVIALLSGDSVAYSPHIPLPSNLPSNMGWF